MKKKGGLFSLFFFVFILLNGFAQPMQLEQGMRRSIAQTMMGKMKIEDYKKEKTTYLFPDSVYFVMEFDKDEFLNGFFWHSKNQAALEKTLEENGFAKMDSVTYGAKNFQGLLKKEIQSSETVYRFTAMENAVREKNKKKVIEQEETPREKPLYGFSILGIKVWEKKENGPKL